MTGLILAIVLLVATSSEAHEYQPSVAGERAHGLRSASQLLPAAVLETASEGNVPTTSMPGATTIRGTATWFCGGGSPCTRGYSPSELIAAIDPTTGIERGEHVTVWHGDRSVTVRIVDVCACPGARIIDLSRIAFARLADPSLGVIPVVLVPARGSQEAQPRMTLPPTDTAEEMP